MPTITLPGLQTGIDTQLIVQQLVAASRGPLEQLQARRSNWESKQAAFATLQTRLESLRSAVDAIRTTSSLRAYTAASNNTERLTVAVGTGASEGAHEIEINQLAAAERQVHAGLAGLDTLVGEGVLAYTYNGETRIIQTTDETTLEALRDLINNDGGNPGVTASILRYDAGGDQVYHLVLSGNDTGADYAVTLEDAQTTLDGTGGTVDLRTSTFTETQSARDAQVRVDGYPSGAWISRSTNSISDILPGVTLNLHAPTGDDETVRISLSRDTEGLKTKISAFTSAYNSVVGYIRQKTAYDAATNTAGVLMGEFTPTTVHRAIRLPLIEAAEGFLDGADAFTLAGQVGLSIDRYGTLEFDEGTFNEAIGENYLGLLGLFGANRTGASDSDILRFYGAGSPTEPGTYDVRAVFESGVLVSAQIKGADEGQDAWRDATVQAGVIIGDANHPEAFLQVTASYAGTGTVEAEVRVRQGFAGRLYDAIDDLLDATDGAVTLVKDRCQSAIDTIDDHIERQQARLTRLEASLRDRFARLERTLTMIEAQRGALAMWFSE